MQRTNFLNSRYCHMLHVIVFYRIRNYDIDSSLARTESLRFVCLSDIRGTQSAPLLLVESVRSACVFFSEKINEYCSDTLAQCHRSAAALENVYSRCNEIAVWLSIMKPVCRETSSSVLGAPRFNRCWHVRHEFLQQHYETLLKKGRREHWRDGVLSCSLSLARVCGFTNYDIYDAISYLIVFSLYMSFADLCFYDM